MANFKEELSAVKAFVFDCDGVFTDCSITLMPPDYEAVRTFNARDGFAVALAVKRGYPVAIISGGKGEGVRRRFEGLGVTHIELGCGDKLEATRRFVQKAGVEMGDVMFMGDDVPDVETMMAVGVPVCPNDAAPENKAVARYISHLCGGKGCVRDVIEQVLKAQGRWAECGSERDIFSR
ncbi:MAG: HAD hydrolase family protein [Rikenellaceae bacterium]|nr:HAD hydrolase family protein [Rikenellaceae bacterium]